MYTATINAATNNVPTAFSTAAGSKIVSSSPTGGILAVINTTDSVLYVSWGVYKNAQVPSSTLPGRMIAVPPAPTGGAGVGVIDGAKVTAGDSIFIMTEAASARTTGKVWVSVI